ncbi:MAG TPA: hypothetical protein VLA36_00710 [Longimicrobiales bacterium]|nr:hypothetical protein [Longimicrobiales bacterium]
MSPRSRLPRRLLPALLGLVTLTSAAGFWAPATAQGTGTGSGVRVGFTFGGISTVGLTLEYYDDQRSVDLTFGTWSFRDLSVSAAVKQYFGAGDLHPFVGGGLWLVAAHPSGERTGFAAVLHAPIGLDWRASGNHFLGATVNVNRALGVRRTDPDDEMPLNKRLVPLPGLYYRWRR